MALFADYFDLAAMDMGQVIQGDGSAPVTRLDFHRHGELCMAASADGRLRIIDALEGRERASARCAQFGVGAARFTHHETSLVHARRAFSYSFVRTRAPPLGVRAAPRARRAPNCRHLPHPRTRW